MILHPACTFFYSLPINQVKFLVRWIPCLLPFWVKCSQHHKTLLHCFPAHSRAVQECGCVQGSGPLRSLSVHAGSWLAYSAVSFGLEEMWTRCPLDCVAEPRGGELICDEGRETDKQRRNRVQRTRTTKSAPLPAVMCCWALRRCADGHVSAQTRVAVWIQHTVKRKMYRVDKNNTDADQAWIKSDDTPAWQSRVSLALAVIEKYNWKTFNTHTHTMYVCVFQRKTEGEQARKGAERTPRSEPIHCNRRLFWH